MIAEAVSVPVIACGGAGRVDHVHEVIAQGKADAVCLASILHYHFIRHHEATGEFSEEGNIEYLRSRRGFSKVREATLPDIKAFLLEQGVATRQTPVEYVRV